MYILYVYTLSDIPTVCVSCSIWTSYGWNMFAWLDIAVLQCFGLKILKVFLKASSAGTSTRWWEHKVEEFWNQPVTTSCKCIQKFIQMLQSVAKPKDTNNTQTYTNKSSVNTAFDFPQALALARLSRCTRKVCMVKYATCHCLSSVWVIVSQWLLAMTLENWNMMELVSMAFYSVLLVLSL